MTAQPSETPPQDYIGEDGLLHCGTCRERKQFRLTLGGREITVPVACECRRAEIQRQRQEDEKRRQMTAMQELKDLSLMSDKYKSATFSAYIRRPGNEKAYRVARNYVDHFDEMYEENQGLLFHGPVGTGKSYTAACIANALLDKQISVVMTSFIKILRVLNNGWEETDYIKRLDSARLLILDDLGTERSTEYALEKIYNTIDSRVRSNKPMILTTNLSLNCMKDPQDMRYTRIYDRILETCYPVKVEGESFRLDAGRKRFVDMRALLEAEPAGDNDNSRAPQGGATCRESV